MFASCVDQEEAYEVGRHAVSVAIKHGGGWMATLQRAEGPDYRIGYDKVQLKTVANSTRQIPRAWMTSDELDVTDEFIRYAEPLVGDEWPPLRLEGIRQRFARLDIRLLDAKCPSYIPVKWR